MVDFYVVPTPLGNPEDITLRAIRILKDADFVVCEHHKEYVHLALALNLPVKEWVECTRSREHECLDFVLEQITAGKVGTLVSDCGSPLFEDPGFYLIRQLQKRVDVNLVSLPGANSLITALPLSHFEVKYFYFAGFISQKKERREQELKALLKRKEVVILLETPYRLWNIVELLKLHAKNRQIVIPFDLTMPTEKVYRGKPDEIASLLKSDGIEKGEFLIIIQGS